MIYDILRNKRDSQIPRTFQQNSFVLCSSRFNLSLQERLNHSSYINQSVQTHSFTYWSKRHPHTHTKCTPQRYTWILSRYRNLPHSAFQAQQGLWASIDVAGQLRIHSTSTSNLSTSSHTHHSHHWSPLWSHIFIKVVRLILIVCLESVWSSSTWISDLWFNTPITNHRFINLKCSPTLLIPHQHPSSTLTPFP